MTTHVPTTSIVSVILMVAITGCSKEQKLACAKGDETIFSCDATEQKDTLEKRVGVLVCQQPNSLSLTIGDPKDKPLVSMTFPKSEAAYNLDETNKTSGLFIIHGDISYGVTDVYDALPGGQNKSTLQMSSVIIMSAPSAPADVQYVDDRYKCDLKTVNSQLSKLKLK